MISQMEYDNYQGSQSRRETPAEREVRCLRRRLDEMEAEKLGISVNELEEKRLEEHCAAIANQPQQETAAMAFVRQEIERRRRADEQWLSAWGVPSDASGELKRVVLCLTEERSQLVVIDLVAACAGEELDRSQPTGRQMLAMFPKLTPAVQVAIVHIAAEYAHLRSQVLFQA
jgi:hypothetical protein